MSGPSAAMLTATTTGHGAFPPTVASTGSDFVFINGIPALHVGHTFIVHFQPGPLPLPHVPVIAGGSSLANINGLPLARIGDPLDCGDAIAQGSDFIFVGG